MSPDWWAPAGVRCHSISVTDDLPARSRCRHLLMLSCDGRASLFSVPLPIQVLHALLLSAAPPPAWLPHACTLLVFLAGRALGDPDFKAPRRLVEAEPDVARVNLKVRLGVQSSALPPLLAAASEGPHAGVSGM